MSTSAAMIVAVSARTPVGLTAESSAAAVRAGICRIGEHPFMVDRAGAPVRGGLDAVLDPALLGWRRLAELARGALLEAATRLDARLAAAGAIWQAPLEVLIGLPEPRPGWTDEDGERVAQYLAGVTLPRLSSLSVRLSGRGHAAVLEALAAAARRVAAGQLPLCLVGGVDSYFDADTLDWLQDHKQLAREGIRAGFFPGEAASFVVLASSDVARRLALPPLAAVCGGQSTIETKLIKTDAINLGEALTAAVGGAVGGLRLPAEAVDSVFCDINGERYRSEEWAFVALKLPQACRDATVYELTSSCWGDVGAASGALFATLAVAGWQGGYARGPRALLVAGSEGGLRAAVLLERASQGGT